MTKGGGGSLHVCSSCGGGYAPPKNANRHPYIICTPPTLDFLEGSHHRFQLTPMANQQRQANQLSTCNSKKKFVNFELMGK